MCTYTHVLAGYKDVTKSQNIKNQICKKGIAKNRRKLKNDKHFSLYTEEVHQTKNNTCSTFADYDKSDRE